MQCVILAGGLGTRIRSVSGDLPKTLIPVGGRPFAFHQLAWLRAGGVTDVVYCIGHKGEMVRNAVGDGRDFGLSVSYCDEGEILRGTGGALRLAHAQRLLSDTFLVVYGDSYLPVPIGPVWDAAVAGREALMVVMRNEGRWDTSNVVYREGQVVRYEKNLLNPAEAGMRHIDYGLSVLTAAVVAERIPDDHPADLADFFTTLSREGRLRGFEVTQRFYEIGSPRGLAELEEHLGRRKGH